MPDPNPPPQPCPQHRPDLACVVKGAPRQVLQAQQAVGVGRPQAVKGLGAPQHRPGGVHLPQLDQLQDHQLVQGLDHGAGQAQGGDAG